MVFVFDFKDSCAGRYIAKPLAFSINNDHDNGQSPGGEGNVGKPEYPSDKTASCRKMPAVRFKDFNAQQALSRTLSVEKHFEDQMIT